MLWKILGIGVLSLLSVLLAWVSGLGSASAFETAENAEHEKKRIEEGIGSREILGRLVGTLTRDILSTIFFLVLSVACVASAVTLSAFFLH
ncbi:MAG: hypothetical protein A2599_01860 [Candidatus Staskawiczbacteria bacterium RIFOXYD1_FULL_39_28]|uniref:Uncharacterized protein n=1 Tax=Candidatus Staskawiczbacteria bacterium RIFOXYC1_FULL_38_18 TaxID=1802229 RepID=A0A1G2JG87_9BACT|nr:MAG: hypothetical protein A2401_00890 [Candidatus Staskawiczbacteria bacterium RIFOXYC1_FULL_38_18]OGZ91775.1 MAG: hypothetical protein A2599_01860 [Candidatus Staskawiczbacteria bacterium RIFOXYD1_FULL_39_28]